MYVTWYTAMSMDGRIADGQNSLAFLDAIGAYDGSDIEFERFLKTVDAVVIGAATLRWLLRSGYGWPHGDLPTWLVSHDAGLVREVGETAAAITRVEGDLASVMSAIEAAGHQRVWLCGGGNVAGQLLALDCVDDCIVTVAPMALGSGPALFDALALPVRRFRLVACYALNEGAARLHWRRERDV